MDSSAQVSAEAAYSTCEEDYLELCGLILYPLFSLSLSCKDL